MTEHNIIPRCHERTVSPYVDHSGQVYPCCWIAWRYQQESKLLNHLPFDVKQFHLNQQSLDDTLMSAEWAAYTKSFGTTHKPISNCIENCSAKRGKFGSQRIGTSPTSRSITREVHVELTSRCTLACPRCSRTRNAGKYAVDDLSLDHVRSIAQNHLYEGVFLCGNLGDPIYHRQFPEVIDILNQGGKKINLTTAGSHRPVSWWEKAADSMERSTHVRVNFSVDGLSDTNGIYRVGSKWDTIMDAMRLCVARGFDTRWKFIIFKHNEHQYEEAKLMAEDMGVKFEGVISGRYGSGYGYEWNDDPLKPSDRFTTQHRNKMLQNQE